MRLGLSVIEILVGFSLVFLTFLPILSAVRFATDPNLKKEAFYFTCDRCSQKTTDTVDIMIYESYSRHHFMICHQCYTPVEKALAK